MSIVYCNYCDRKIDTDFNASHFNENNVCIYKEAEEKD